MVSSNKQRFPLGLVFQPQANTPSFGLVSMYHNLSQLKRMIISQREMGLSDIQLRYDYWQQVFEPLLIIFMMMLAVPFVLRSTREVSIGSQIFKGILIGFGVYILNVIVGRLCMIIAIDPFFAALTPVLFIAGLFLIKVRKKI